MQKDQLRHQTKKIQSLYRLTVTKVHVIYVQKSIHMQKQNVIMLRIKIPKHIQRLFLVLHI